LVDRETLRRITEKKHSYVLFSGGKDSLCSLALLKETASGQLTAVHVDTTVSLPENLQYVENMCKTLEVPLVVLRPKKDFFTQAKKIGAPRFNARWCCFALKIKPMRDFLRSQPPGRLVFDGIRNEESIKRRDYKWVWYDRRHFKCFVIHPIIDWSESQVLNFLKERNLLLNVERSFRKGSFGKHFFLKDIEKQQLLQPWLLRQP